jgi:hypothetical protein
MKKIVISTFLISLLLVGGAFAAPTAQIIGGLTAVDLSPEFLQAINSLNVTPSAVGPGSLDLETGRARFPIPGGAIDLGSLEGDIFHTGGLALAVPDTKVSLLNFIISTTGESPVLTGLAVVDDDVEGRVPLFNLELTQSPQVGEYGTIIITDVNLTLTQTAADTLNNAFGTTAFVEDFSVGSAVVVAQSLESSDNQGDDGNADQEQTDEDGNADPEQTE